jgi:hypothetical protein
MALRFFSSTQPFVHGKPTLLYAAGFNAELVGWVEQSATHQ